jgi:hypothetical protein
VFFRVDRREFASVSAQSVPTAHANTRQPRMFGEFVVEGAAAGVGCLGGPVDAAAGQPGWFSLTGVLHAFSSVERLF